MKRPSPTRHLPPAAARRLKRTLAAAALAAAAGAGWIGYTSIALQSSLATLWSLCASP